ncbi:hypothetical protein [Francisella sp. SYW-9]|uniref:hypothetical protein n=1 Tax=Francisella sp. SYW-9 TaxID=2610888 RepID=UPI00123D75FF|nr:hypothetical protein [Francisella sp. SYW-9]
MFEQKSETLITEKAIKMITESGKALELISICDDIALPPAVIADMTGVTVVTIHNWFENGKLTNVATDGQVKKAKFKEFKHLIKRKEA